MARNEVAATNVGRVRQLLCGQHPARCKPVLDGRNLFEVGGGGRSGVDLRDQMREPLVATLSELHLVADPTHRSLGGVASLQLVGAFDAPSTSISRERNSESTEKSKPGSVSWRPSANLQS